MNDPVITLALADDHRVVRLGLEALVDTFEDVRLVGSADGGAEAIALCREKTPDVLLLDLSMPEVDGVTVARTLREQGVPTRVVIFTSFSDRDGIMRALDAGAIGYLLKDADPSEIHAAIRAASRGEAPLTPKAAMELLRQRHPVGVGAGHAPETVARPQVDLTDRERQVLGLLASGLANKQIARRLGISEKTVKGHLTNLFQRIGVSDRTQAALWAERTGALRIPAGPRSRD
ncbi:MAG: response regulator transcription factor [Actinomycetota bacterium]|nr:response regulator transcription factor [Actinomycetota bacterium]